MYFNYIIITTFPTGSWMHSLHLYHFFFNIVTEPSFQNSKNFPHLWLIHLAAGFASWACDLYNSTESSCSEGPHTWFNVLAVLKFLRFFWMKCLAFSSYSGTYKIHSQLCLKDIVWLHSKLFPVGQISNILLIIYLVN